MQKTLIAPTAAYCPSPLKLVLGIDECKCERMSDGSYSLKAVGPAAIWDFP